MYKWIKIRYFLVLDSIALIKIYHENVIIYAYNNIWTAEYIVILVLGGLRSLKIVQLRQRQCVSCIISYRLSSDYRAVICRHSNLVFVATDLIPPDGFTSRWLTLINVLRSFSGQSAAGNTPNAGRLTMVFYNKKENVISLKTNCQLTLFSQRWRDVWDLYICMIFYIKFVFYI